jgi:hypothetical protein
MSVLHRHAVQRRAQEGAFALLDAALRCDCDQEGVPLCVSCACLFSLAAAASRWAYEDYWHARGVIPPPTWRPPHRTRKEETPHG